MKSEEGEPELLESFSPPEEPEGLESSSPPEEPEGLEFFADKLELNNKTDNNFSTLLTFILVYL